MADPRFLGAFLVPMVICLLLYPWYIRLMQRLSWGQEIRPDGPEDHLSKKGTPTTGGAIVLLSFLSVLAFTGTASAELRAVIAYTLANGFLGLADDWVQVARKRSMGLKARQKLMVQFVLGGLLVAFVHIHEGAHLWLPVLGWVAWPWVQAALDLLILVATGNAVNLTDGLDGLAGGTVAIASLAFVPVCLATGSLSAASHPELALACVAMAGACVGFLWYNCFPARIFMGDTGSLALGSFLAAVTIMTRSELMLALVGGLFMVEALSVIIQVGYFKYSKGKRVFRMAPIHHHFCKGGLHEVQVTTRSWIVCLVLAVVAVWSFLHGGFGHTGP